MPEEALVPEMVRTNLATRPFHDDRIFRVAVAVVIVLLVGATGYNAVSWARLASRQSALGAHAAGAEREAARLRAEAAGVRTRIDPREVASVAAAAREANHLIDRRTFSWSGLFAQLEATLPADVRVKAVQPRVADGVFHLVIAAEAKRVDDLEAFIVALEKTGAFSAVSPLEESSGEGGVIEAVIDGRYVSAPVAGGR